MGCHLLWEEEWLRTEGMLGIYSSPFSKIYANPRSGEKAPICVVSLKLDCLHKIEGCCCC